MLKDYDITILYHSEKANIVANSMSYKEKSFGSLAYVLAMQRPLALDVRTWTTSLLDCMFQS